MKTNTYLGRLRVTIGEYENNVSYLVLANSDEAARQELDRLAASYYGDGSAPREDEGYYANAGEIHVRAHSLEAIGLASYLDLRGKLPEWRAANVVSPGPAMLDESVQSAATALREALAAQLGVPVPQSAMLHALAASWGEKNWHVLKAKLAAPQRSALDALAGAARDALAQVRELPDGSDMRQLPAGALDELARALQGIVTMKLS